MKIVRRSNFDHEDWRGNEWIAAENIPTAALAELMCAALNDRQGEHSDDFFVVVSDDYVLPPKWEP